MNRTLACLLLVAACALAPATFARDTLHASAYGLVLDDLLVAFYADIVPCDDGANGVPEICFLTETVGAAFLAERLSDVVSDYRSAGLSSGGWRSANGVWTVTLSFANYPYGLLEVYLAETPDNCVKGLVRLVKP